MKLPLSVMTGPSFFSPIRIATSPPMSFNAFVTGLSEIGIISTGSGKAPRVSTSLDSSAMIINSSAE